MSIDKRVWNFDENTVAIVANICNFYIQKIDPEASAIFKIIKIFTLDLKYTASFRETRKKMFWNTTPIAVIKAVINLSVKTLLRFQNFHWPWVNSSGFLGLAVF